MKEDTKHCLEMIKEAIIEKDKLKFSNFMVALEIKGKRDIADL